MKKNKMTTKALSMLLAVIMLFTTISVGIIVPDAKVNAAETGETITVTTIAQINSAIATANTAGVNKITTIKLGSNITYTGSLASFTTLSSANVVFDFNGYSLLMNYTISEGREFEGSSAAQLPSANSGRTDTNGVDTFTNGMFIIGAGSTMQIINTKPNNICTMQVYTDFEDTHRGGYQFGDVGNKELHNYASSSLIYSEGTLIVGDKDNTSYNDFTLYAHSSVRNTNKDNPNSYYKKSANTNCYTVTINNSNAIFKMYGGKVEATSVSVARRGLWTDVICYALNVNNCYSAEIYGGEINIPKSPYGDNSQYCGIAQITGNASDGATARISAIRSNTPYLYIFDVNSSVQTRCSADSSKYNNLYTSCIYTTADKNAPYIYGGNYNYSAVRAGGNSTAINNGWVVRGAYKLASSGTLTPSAVSGSNHGATTVDAGNTGTDSFTRYTVFVGDNGILRNVSNSILKTDMPAENGIDMFSYNTFRDYLAQYSSTLDVYHGNSIMTTNGDANTSLTTTDYRLNGYSHKAWAGKTHPGDPYSLSKTTPTNANITGGGSLFLVPVWEENTYTITHDLNDDAISPVVDTSSCPVNYSITSTKTLGAPVRNGYVFNGWAVTAYDYDAFPDSRKPWSLGAVYPADFSVTGRNGNISLQAQWSAPVSYNATFNLNGGMVNGSTDNIVKSYTVKSTNATIPSAPMKSYYTFDGTYEVISTDLNGSSWANGDKFEAGSLIAQGNYGDVTFVANYTPIPYTITFESNGGSVIDALTYDYESSLNLPVPIRTGYSFVGWQPETSSGAWDENKEGGYSIGETYTNMHGNVKLVAKWNPATATVTLDPEGAVIANGTTQFGYSFASSYELPFASKPGYVFKGWEVSAVPSYTKDIPIENRWEMGKQYLLVNGLVILEDKKIGDVTLKPVMEPDEYTITFNLNGGKGDGITDIPYTIKDKVTLNTPSKDGSVFTGWLVTGHGDIYNWTDSDLYLAGEYEAGHYGDVTLTAQWENAEYTVTYNPNGGTVSKATDEYSIVDRPEYVVPSRTGYIFEGWKVEDAGESNWPEGKLYDAAEGLLPLGFFGDIELVAQWVPEEYEIRLHSRGDKDNKVIRYNITDEIILDESVLGGYEFEYWVVNQSNGNWAKDEKYYPGTVYSGKHGNVDLTAEFKARTYTITYKDVDGSVIYEGTYTNEDALTIRMYEKAGYKADSWKVTSDDAVGWSSAVAFGAELGANERYGNVVLTPERTAENYTISFIPDGGTPYPDKEYTIESEEKLPIPEKTGYNFKGWKVTAAAGNWTENEVVEGESALSGRHGSVTLTAQWEAKTYKITWITGSGEFETEGKYNEMPVPTGVNTDKKADAQYTYTFASWSPSLTTITGDATYTAQYSTTVNSYTVTWIYDVSETETKTETATYSYGVHPVFNGGVNPVKTSSTGKYYRFNGWKDTAGNSLTDATLVTGNVTYIAQFIEIEAPKTITWVIDGKPQETQWAVGEIPSYVGTPVKADKDGMKYTFTGWTPAITAVDKDFTYTAQFTESAQTYVADFNLNGGTYNGATEVSYNKIDGLKMPQPQKAGYTFTGWKVVANDGTWTQTTPYIYTQYAGFYGNVSFNAQYEATEYTIKVEADDGTTPEYKYTIESTGTLPVLENDGYTLSGWMIVTGEGNWMTGDTVPTDKVLAGMYGNVTIHPIWTARLYKINWVSGDITQTVEFRYGDAVVAYPPISKAGYTAQWDNTVPAVMPATDLTFNAVYSPIQYYLRFNTAGGSTVENFYYNIISTATLPTPVRDGATFKGWKLSAGTGNWSKTKLYDGGTLLTGMYGNVTLTAVWEIQLYTVTWVTDEENDIKKISKWYHGAVPSYDGIPYKASDDSYSYTFAGWDKEIVTVTGHVTYTALYTKTERLYTITWNIDGYTTTKLYKYGQMPIYEGKEPTRESTVEYDFTFAGWTPEISTVTGDITYTAIFDVFTKLQGLRVDKAAVFLKVGEEAVLSAIISPATASNKDVQWISSDEGVATVNSNGRITAVGSGEALVRVQSKDGNYKSYCLVTVSPVITEYLVVSAGYVSTTRLPGEAIQLSARVMPENATNKNVIWTSSNTAIATVDENGLVVFGNVAGTAIISASADGYATGSIEVTTTTKSAEVEENANTYAVMFLASSSSYIIAGNTYEAITIICNEGDTIEFLLTEPHFVTANGVQFARDTDGVYRIKNISQNYSIVATERADLGLDEDIEDQPQQKSFFDKIKDFFRSIVEFFRNLFS